METSEFLALQNLLYDGEPEEVAQNFLKHGNLSLEKSESLAGEKMRVKLADAIHSL